MSRHPDNPHWCQVHDQPHPIERGEWEAAAAAGFVTTEHVQARIDGMLHHALRLDGPIGYDADGFMISLTAAGIRVDDRIRIDIRTHDHNPPHAHIVVRGEPQLALKVNLETATLMGAMPRGMSKTGKKIEQFVRENQPRLLELWSSYRQSELRR